MSETETLFKFADLDARAKERARDWWREGEAQDFEPNYEDFLIVAGILGVDIKHTNERRPRPCIYWGLHAQGSGACFEGSYAFEPDASAKIRDHAPEDADLHSIADDLTALQQRQTGKSFLDGLVRLDGAEWIIAGQTRLLSAKITHSGNYTYARSMDVEACDIDTGEDASGADTDALKDILCRFADWIYRAIEAEDEWHMSDENVDECIDANEYDFTEDGARAD